MTTLAILHIIYIIVLIYMFTAAFNVFYSLLVAALWLHRGEIDDTEDIEFDQLLSKCIWFGPFGTIALFYLTLPYQWREKMFGKTKKLKKQIKDLKERVQDLEEYNELARRQEIKQNLISYLNITKISNPDKFKQMNEVVEMYPDNFRIEHGVANTFVEYHLQELQHDFNGFLRPYWDTIYTLQIPGKKKKTSKKKK